MIHEALTTYDLVPVQDAPATLFDMLVHSCRIYPDKLAYIYQAESNEIRVSYEKLFEDVLVLARSFGKVGVSKGDKIMLLSDNRYAWIVTDLAILSLGAVNVPRGSDTPTLELEFIVNNSQATYLIVETDKLLEKHKKFIKGARRLKRIFVMTGDEKHTLFSRRYSYNELLKDRTYSAVEVKKFLELGATITPEQLLTIIYTSGTTGMPKGVQLTHANIMHNVRCIPKIIGLKPDDSWLSILPSWHIFERTAEYAALYRGTCLVYSSVKRFSSDLEKYRPTLVATVPRVWESLYAKVQQGVKKKGKVAMTLFQSLVAISASYRRNQRRYHDQLPRFTTRPVLVGFGVRSLAAVKMILLFPLFKLAEKKLMLVQERFGGRLRLAISGGGSLAGYLEEWIDAVGIRIVNAYGMTECSPAIAGRGLGCEVFATCGPAVAETDLRIVSETGEPVAAGEEGLVEVRGPQVTPGYYQNDEETEKSFTRDGFFKTGDLGRMTVTGELVLTGRAKEIIVLASGENIDPTRIENTITMFPFIEDAVLVGQDKKGLGALLVPNLVELKAFITTKMGDYKKEDDELLDDRSVVDHVKREMNRLLQPGKGFRSYEKLQHIVFLKKEFTMGEELTNTLKKKRHIIEKKYKELINSLFA